MTTVTETVDAVIGGDTYRDTHALEMTAPNCATIATLTIPNNASGFRRRPRVDRRARPLPRVVGGLEGTRNYGIGLARVSTGDRADHRRGRVSCGQTRHRGKFDPIDARLATLQVLRMPEESKDAAMQERWP